MHTNSQLAILENMCMIMDAVLPPAQGCGELYDTEGLHQSLKLQINRNQNAHCETATGTTISEICHLLKHCCMFPGEVNSSG